MKITSIKTDKIVPGGPNIYAILDKFVTDLPERSILAVTSKIVSICENNVVPMDQTTKKELAEREADYSLPSRPNKYGQIIRIKNGILCCSSGVDGSNSNGYYVLWPRDPQKSANKIRQYLKKKFHLQHVGVLITDTKLLFQKRGTIGAAIAHSGFKALRNYIGQPDIFRKDTLCREANEIEALAATAVFVMGEADEQTPLALIENIPYIEFQDRNPSTEELDQLIVKMEDDRFAPLLQSVDWQENKN